MSKYPFDSARQLQIRKQFEKAERLGRELAPGSELERLQARVERIRKQQQQHFERLKPVWIARETNELLQKHKGQLQPSLSPKYVLQTETSPAALAKRAYRNVEERIQTRIEKTESISARMIASLKNNITAKQKMDM